MAAPEDDSQSADAPLPVEAPGPKARRGRVAAGITAGVIWFLLFSGGLLIDSESSRVALGWKKENPSGQIELGTLTQKLLATETATSGQTGGAAPVPVAPDSPPAPADAKSADKMQVLTQAVKEEEKKQKEKTSETQNKSLFWNFCVAMLFFTPLNVALLALLAGFIGGCASSAGEHRLVERDLQQAIKVRDENRVRLLERRLVYLRESPFYSMIRSFVVYLLFISGLYVIATDPFNPTTQSQGFTQYMRLAGLVSLLGFVVGYDPTRFFDQWLALIPSPGRNGGQELQPPQGKHVTTIEAKDPSEVTITQTSEPAKEEAEEEPPKKTKKAKQ